MDAKSLNEASLILYFVFLSNMTSVDGARSATVAAIKLSTCNDDDDVRHACANPLPPKPTEERNDVDTDTINKTRTIVNSHRILLFNFVDSVRSRKPNHLSFRWFVGRKEIFVADTPTKQQPRANFVVDVQAACGSRELYKDSLLSYDS